MIKYDDLELPAPEVELTFAENRIAELVNEVAELRHAMASRAVIEQAKGIIIASVGCDEDRAFEMLVCQSQHENRKLREVAQDLVRSKQRRQLRVR